MLKTNDARYLLEAWSEGYVSRMVDVGRLRGLQERGLLLETCPLCWVLTGSGVHFTWQMVRYFQSSKMIRRNHPALLERFEFLYPVPNLKKKVV